jgi:hypothetical protein
MHSAYRRDHGPSALPTPRFEGQYLERAEALGGKKVVPPTDLPGDQSRYAIFADPDGNLVGLWA